MFYFFFGFHYFIHVTVFYWRLQFQPTSPNFSLAPNNVSNLEAAKNLLLLGADELAAMIRRGVTWKCAYLSQLY